MELNQAVTVTANEAGGADVSVSNEFTDPTAYLPVASYLGVDLKGADTDQLKAIQKFLAEDVKSDRPGDMLMALKSIEQRLSSPKLGETRAGNVYRYIKSVQAVRDAEKERDALVR